MKFFLGEIHVGFEKQVKDWTGLEFSSKLKRKDVFLWGRTRSQQVQNRLGWLDLPESMRKCCSSFEEFTEKIKSEDFQSVVLLGMGGSSLAAGVFQCLAGASSRGLRFFICNTTHPEAVLTIEKAVGLDRTLFIVSSKSGTTLETLSLYRFFRYPAAQKITKGNGYFIAITDPGTPLDKEADKLGFRRVFHAAPDVGGRFSALSEFGLLPASLVGWNPCELLSLTGKETSEDDYSNGIRLGAALAQLSLERNKLTLITPLEFRCFSEWLEQLLAESLGKDSKGLVPVVGEPLLSADSYGRDRSFVFYDRNQEKDKSFVLLRNELQKRGHPVIVMKIPDGPAIGREMFLWEIAVAAAGAAMNVNPFDQPDVQLTKKLTAEMMDSSSSQREVKKNTVPKEKPSGEIAENLKRFSDLGRKGDYFALQAFLPQREDISERLQNLRLNLANRTGMATTLGFGPGFLHSTGQLHKGGVNNGLFIQFVDTPSQDCAVPGMDYSFGQLIAAQALGDYLALKNKKRKVIRIHLGKNPLKKLDAVLKYL